MTGRGSPDNPKAMITQFTDDQNFTDEQKRYMQQLLKDEAANLGGWHAMHGPNQGFRCAYCGRDFLVSYDAFYSLTIDHITPTCCDGEHTFENTLVCCRTCNFLKHEYSPVGDSREERIADARCRVKKLRETREAAVAKLRLFVRGDSPSTHHETPLARA